jgi:aspartyl-tRNA(Asn)/glutamyl-tRNA(Gln) amidotransferase subunit A
MTNQAELLTFDVDTLGDKLRRKEISPIELTAAYLKRIEQLDPQLRCYITVTADKALVDAKRVEAEILSGNWRGPFHGVPVALKDLCSTKGIRTTGGSKILADHVPAFDSTVWARLAAAGAILLGKLNLHEFAAGVTNSNPHWGICRNPYNLERIPGGSSGGSGAAIAARLAAATIGTDTGGSIRIPAAFCGCVGMKQTWSRVSRYGVLPLANSLDHAGPLTRSVRDAALMLQVIAGHDPNDATSSQEPVPNYAAACDREIKGLSIGVTRELQTGLSEAVAASFNAALIKLQELGASINEVSIPAIKHVSAVVTTITFAEAAEYHQPWIRTRADDYGKDVRRALEAGMLMPAMHYIRAQRARAMMLAEAQTALQECSVLVAPTSAIPAPRIHIGANALLPNGDPVDMVESILRFTALFNVTGQPALAIPTGLAPDGLPLSMQIIGRAFDEPMVLQIAAAYEAARGPLMPPQLV